MTTQLATRPGRAAAVTLRVGSAIWIRQLTGADTELLADGFSRLSLASRQFRFLTGKPRLSAAELRHLTAVDHHDHEALVALSRSDGRAVGVARFVRYAANPQVADVAVTVVDEWHGRGLGTELVTRLVDRAVTEGLSRFTASIAADNLAVLRLLRNIGVDYQLVGYEAGIADYEILLPPRRLDAA